MRKLASIQKIVKITPIENADSLEVATVLGWKIVVKKGEFKENEKILFIEVDAILPEKPEFEFMRSRKFKVKTIKLRGQISQGIVFPLNIIPGYSGNPEDYPEDMDVTEVLGVTKFEPQQPPTLTGSQKSPYRYKYPRLPKFIYDIMRKLLSQQVFRKYLCVNSGNGFPNFIPKTDETRVQVLQGLLTKYKGTTCYVTEKLDGSSITCYLKDGEFGVCSRNVDLKKEAGNTFWDTVEAMGIESKLKTFARGKRNLALQGELIGEGIQGNKLKIKGYTIRFFNVFDIDEQRYFNFFGFKAAIESMGLETVPVITETMVLNDNIEELVEAAKGNSVVCSSAKREGIVIRPLEETEELDEARGYLVRNRLSFKAINPEFLLKYDE